MSISKSPFEAAPTRKAVRPKRLVIAKKVAGVGRKLRPTKPVLPIGWTLKVRLF